MKVLFRWRTLWVLGCVLAWARPSVAGDFFSLSEKLYASHGVVEIYVPVEGKVPKNWPNKTYDPRGWGFPDVLVGKASAERRRLWPVDATESLSGVDPTKSFLFSGGSRCWWKAHQKGGLRSLVFVDAQGNAVRFGVEHERGRYTDLNPAYEELIAAITWFFSNRDNLTTARALLHEKQKNPYLLMVGGAVLMTHGGHTDLEKHIGGADSALYKRIHQAPDDTSFCR